MKRFTSILLACLLVMSFAFAGVSAAATNTISVTDIPDADIGEEITVKVSFSPELELVSGGISFEFDTTALEFVSGKWTPEATYTVNNFNLNDSHKAVFLINGAAVKFGADCCELTFKVLSSAVNGNTYDISVSASKLKNQTSDEGFGIEAAEGSVTIHNSCEFGAWVKYDEDQHVRSCAICGEEEKAPHNWDNGKVTKEATHLEKGVKTFTCADCGATRTEDIDTVAHTGGKATCKRQAICSVCSTAYGELDPSNHANTKVINTKAATTTEEGYTGDTVCADCGAHISSGSIIEKIVNPPTSDNSVAQIAGISVFGLALVFGACIAYNKKRDF